MAQKSHFIAASRGKMACVAFATIFLCSCANMQNGQRSGANKEMAGTAIGAVLGGVAGALLGGKRGKGWAIAAGTLVGGAIGNRVGAYLDNRDREAIALESAKALSLSQDGQTTQWSNPNSGASATIMPVSTQIQNREMTIIREKQVSYVPSLELIGKPYRAKKSTNVRASPESNAVVISRLKTNEEFNAVAKVSHSDWIMVGKGQRSVGYVHKSLVQPVGSVRRKTAAPMRKAVNLDEIASDNTVVADKVNVQTECRKVNYQIKTRSGQGESENFEACKSPDGAWELS